MGFRAKDEIIYSRVYGKTRKEFDQQMMESGYKNSADFIDYLLRVNKGKQVDGVKLKDVMEALKDVIYELKKQGININQIARYVNSSYFYGSEEFIEFEKAYKDLEKRILELLERVV